MGDKPRLELFTGLAALYHSRDYSDLVLFGKDGGRHPVHRAIVCPRSQFFYDAVRDCKWREGNEGHLALPDDDEVVRLVVEYLYLLDYDPLVGFSDDSSSSHPDSSDTMSVRTDAGQYGTVYGTSAVSAFGGPANITPAAFATIFRPRGDSDLTVHARSSSGADFASFANAGTGPPRVQRRRSGRGDVSSPPDPSPLATKEAHLTLHARIYAAAHRYGIMGLKALSLDKFKIQLTRHWDSSELAEAIHLVYNSTPSSDKDMRESIADVLNWHSPLLDKPEIEIAIMEINGLAYELLKRSRRAEPEYSR